MPRNSSRFATRLGLVAGLALLTAATLPAVAQAVTPSAPAGTLVVSSQHVNADGSQTATWRQGRTTLTISGDFGGAVSATSLVGPTKPGAPTASGGIDVAVSTRVQDDSRPEAAVAAYARADRSVVNDAIATGVAPDVARRIFGRMESTATTGAGAALAGSPTSAARILDSFCVNLSGDAGNAKAHGCVTRNIDYKNNGNWYIANHEIVSGRDNDWWYAMDKLKIWLVYSKGNTVVDWAPNGTFPVHSCSSITMGVTDPKTGINFSTSTDVCPDSMGPVWTNNYRGFGAEWRGYSSDYQGAVATTVVHKPRSATTSATLHVYMHWS